MTWRPSNHIPTPAPGGRTPPANVLRELRRVDENVDVHYIGEGRWAVGVVEENAYRRKVGGERKKNAAIQGAPRKFRMAKLTYRGYQHFAFYDVESPINLLKAVPEFRRADWLYRTNREQAFKESSSASFGIRNRSSDEEFMEEIEQRISAAYPYLFKGRRHFRQPGLGG